MRVNLRESSTSKYESSNTQVLVEHTKKLLFTHKLLIASIKLEMGCTVRKSKHHKNLVYCIVQNFDGRKVWWNMTNQACQKVWQTKLWRIELRFRSLTKKKYYCGSIMWLQGLRNVSIFFDHSCTCFPHFIRIRMWRANYCWS